MVGPVLVDCAPHGTLFRGRETVVSVGATPRHVTRVGPGGTPAADQGSTTKPNPDAVVNDVAVRLSGVSGSAVFRGASSTCGGVISADGNAPVDSSGGAILVGPPACAGSHA